MNENEYTDYSGELYVPAAWEERYSLPDDVGAPVHPDTDHEYPLVPESHLTGKVNPAEFVDVVRRIDAILEPVMNPLVQNNLALAASMNPRTIATEVELTVMTNQSKESPVPAQAIAIWLLRAAAHEICWTGNQNRLSGINAGRTSEYESACGQASVRLTYEQRRTNIYVVIRDLLRKIDALHSEIAAMGYDPTALTGQRAQDRYAMWLDSMDHDHDGEDD